MYLDPSENTFVAADGSVDIGMFFITNGYPARRFFERYRGKGLDRIDVDGLEDGLRTTENDRRIAGDVCLELG